MKRRAWWILVLLSVLITLQAASYISYIREQNELRRYVDRVTQSGQPPSEQAKEIVLSFKDKPDVDNNSYFLLPIFRPLRPTATQVLQHGGDCGDRSRLLITLLRLRGIRGAKWALYNAHGESKHAVVEAQVETGQMVLDPLFGIWFPNPHGGYFGINDLRRNPEILTSRLGYLRAQKVQPGVDRLELYPEDEYFYSNARTINWTKTAPLRTAFVLLHAILRERANEISRPEFVEEPALMVIYGCVAGELFVITIWLWIRKWPKKLASMTLEKLPVETRA